MGGLGVVTNVALGAVLHCLRLRCAQAQLRTIGGTTDLSEYLFITIKITKTQEARAPGHDCEAREPVREAHTTT